MEFLCSSERTLLIGIEYSVEESALGGGGDTQLMKSGIFQI